LSIFGTNHNDNGVLFDEFIKILTQLRHMTLAKWSSKSTIKDQDNILDSTIIREMEWFPLEVG